MAARSRRQPVRWAASGFCGGDWLALVVICHQWVAAHRHRVSSSAPSLASTTVSGPSGQARCAACWAVHRFSPGDRDGQAALAVLPDNGTSGMRKRAAKCYGKHVEA